MKKYLIGSKLLGLDDVKSDTDYIVIVGEEQEDSVVYDNGIDYHYRRLSSIENTMLFRLPYDSCTIRYYVVNYQLDKDIIRQGFPYKFSVLDYRDKYIEMLNWIVDNKACNFKRCKYLNDGNCSQAITHVAYTAFIMQNRSVELTSEQRGVVQKLHDMQMPQDYLDELEKIIRNLRTFSDEEGGQ